MKRVLALLVLAALAAPFLLAPGARADVGPKLFGKIAQDGTLVGLTWTDILGQYQGISDGDLIQENLLHVTVYAPNVKNATITLTVTQFLERDVQVPYTVGNETFTRTVVQRYDVTGQNFSVVAPKDALATSDISLATETTPHEMEIGYLNAVWTLTHRTAPAVWPIGVITRGGQLAFFLSTLVLTSVVWGFGTATASAIHRKVRYWPKMDPLMWFTGVMTLGGAALVLIIYGWYEITGIDWWWWMVPTFILSVFVMLNYLPSRAEPWLLERIHGTPRNDELVTSIQRIVVAEDRVAGFVLVHSRSVRKAVLRLFGAKTKVEFDEGPPAWYMRNENYEDGALDIPRRKYLLDPATKPEITYERFGWKPWVWKLKRPGIINGTCKIPLSGQHMRPVAAYSAGLMALPVVARDREEWRLRATQFKAQLRAGALTEHIDDAEVLAAELGITEGVVTREVVDARIDELRASRNPEAKAKVHKVEPEPEVE